MSTDKIVISGISGRLPESSNIEEFKKHLYEGTDLITEDNRRWPSGLHGLRNRSGKLKNLTLFDESFFSISPNRAHQMDPQLRILLEATYEAIIDAGLSPSELKGSNTGVYIGCSTSEACDFWNSDSDQINGHGLLGGCRTMLANMISFNFDLTGPSMAIDVACASAMVAFYTAVEAIKTGQCDSAFVGAINLLLDPNYSLQFNKLGMLSPDGKCMSFDASGEGYVRSEAIVVVYLQKATKANRVYANVLGVGCNTNGCKNGDITYPSAEMQKKLIREVYGRAGVDPKEVVYIEAHGTGSKLHDAQELNMIVDIFCGDDRKGLLIGSVKSNMGHGEAASGLCSLVKVIIAMENGEIPSNLHYKNPNKGIAGLIDGRLKVVTKNQQWDGGIVGVNCFGIGGTNVHVILSSNQKEKPLSKSCTVIPYLVTVSGRTAESVEYFLEKIHNHSYDQEFYSLLNKAHSHNITGHDYRGFSVIGNSNIHDFSQTSGLKDTQVWYVFSGMGSQWPGMGKQLLNFPPFRKTIERCAKVLNFHNIDLIDILTNDNKAISENVLNSFVAITSIQIALVNILKLIGLEPDGIIGHSVGEVTCGYADNTTNLEETMLISYYRGKALVEADVQKGAMTAIGLSWNDCQKYLSNDLELACNNGPNNVTVSGSTKSIENFVQELSANGIFARVVDTSGYAFHSTILAKIGPILEEILQKVIPHPKRRSSKWVSSSIRETQRNTNIDFYNSGAYQANNFVSPVHFYESTQSIPDGALVLELGPHCLLQTILKRSLGDNVMNIGLMKKGDSSIESFLANIGRIYSFGKDIDVAALHPKVDFPVSRGTPMVSSMIKWKHSGEWTVPDFTKKRTKMGAFSVEIDLSKDEYKFLAGHIIDGRVLFPATGYIVLIWKLFAKTRNHEFQQIPIVIEDMRFLRATIIPPEGPIEFFINILKGSGEFEICENEAIVATGKISTRNIPNDAIIKPLIQKQNFLLNKVEVYKELRLTGYEHIDAFQKIVSTDFDGNEGILEWDGNWVTFMDSMLQLFFLDASKRVLRLPTGIREIVIDPKAHCALNLTHIPININRKLVIMQAGGVSISGLKSSSVSKKNTTPKRLRLEKYVFVPFECKEFTQREVICVISQLVLENCPGVTKLKIGQVDGTDETLGRDIKDEIENEFFIIAEYILINRELLNENRGMHLVIAGNAHTDLSSNIIDGGFLLLIQSQEHNFTSDFLNETTFELVCKISTADKMYILTRKPQHTPFDPLIIEIKNGHFEWAEMLKNALVLNETKKTKIYIYSYDKSSGILGLLKCLLREPGGENVRAFLIHDKKVSKFNPINYEQIVRKDLTQNVFKNGIWGTYKHIPVDPNSEDKLITNTYINATVKSDLSSLSWIEGNLKFCSEDRNICSVYYAALNFRDVMLASGKLNPDALPGQVTQEECLLGLEFSGRDINGKRIMGIVGGKAMATTVLCDPVFTWEVPKSWSLEDAVTVPLAYATSYYSLIVRGKMKPGETILIHAGSGSVGQASISISLHMGCKVFTTVSTNEKREYLKQHFPQLTDDRIGYSRDTSFEKWILYETSGLGVDLVLNSLAGDQLQASLRCLATNGRFLEIGKVDLFNDTSLGVSVFLKNISFNGILLDNLFSTDCEDKYELRRLIHEGISNGVVQPLKNTIFMRHEAEKAFRFLASGKHIGKVSLRIREEELVQIVKPAVLQIKAIPRIYFNPQKVFIIIGGLGGLGLELTNWMISRGANRIILVSRSGVKSSYQSFCLNKWKLQKANVHICTSDITKSESVKHLLQNAKRFGVIAGIFNLAGVLKDGVMVNQTSEQFELVSRAKITTTQYLDEESRIYAPNLEYFVVFSSIASGRGNPGQTNYAFANSAMERICEERTADKLPALAIQWGPIRDVGMLADEEENNSKIAVMLRAILQNAFSCLDTLGKFLQQTNSVVACTELAEKKDSREKSERNFVDVIVRILGINDVTKINPKHSLVDIGLDSLMGIEIKQALEIKFDLVLDLQEIRALTFEMLERLEKEKYGNSTMSN